MFLINQLQKSSSAAIYHSLPYVASAAAAGRTATLHVRGLLARKETGTKHEQPMEHCF